MKLQRDTGFQFALVKEILDANAQKQQVEEKIRAAEEWQSLLLRRSSGVGQVPVRSGPYVGKMFSMRRQLRHKTSQSLYYKSPVSPSFIC